MSGTVMIWKERLSKWGTLLLATGGFSGFFPIAPGTAGSVVGVALVWWLRSAPLGLFAGLTLLLLAVGTWASHRAGKIFGVVDSGHIVIDEIVGVMITMMGIPATAYWLVWGFVLFRIFDVIKLPPANIFDERVKNGFGVMMDDVAAGVYGNVLLHLMLRATI